MLVWPFYFGGVIQHSIKVGCTEQSNQLCHVQQLQRKQKIKGLGLPKGTLPMTRNLPTMPHLPTPTKEYHYRKRSLLHMHFRDAED
jgi:hypothetical protein